MSFAPILPLDVELTEPVATITGLDGYGSARLLVRERGMPIGSVDVIVRDGVLAADDVGAALRRAGLHARERTREVQVPESWPTLSVAICTRGRPDDLAICLTHATALDYEDLEILVIDNAPLDDRNAIICAAFPRVRRVVEEQPGLNHARNRAVAEAGGAVLAFLDDDAIPDRNWARSVAAPFALDAAVVGVTGLVVPYELETPAQVHFESYGGFGCGFVRRRFDWSVSGPQRHEIMECGTGANMAFCRSVFERVGLFDPALDAGTPTGGGGDIDMFFRVLRAGGVLVYEPAALVRHIHRRDDESLQRQIMSWGTGMVAVFSRNAMAYPGEALALLRLGVTGAVRNVARLTSAVFRAPAYPRRLLLAELQGTLLGIVRYRRSRRLAGPVQRTPPETR